MNIHENPRIDVVSVSSRKKCETGRKGEIRICHAHATSDSLMASKGAHFPIESSGTL